LNFTIESESEFTDEISNIVLEYKHPLFDEPIDYSSNKLTDYDETVIGGGKAWQKENAKLAFRINEMKSKSKIGGIAGYLTPKELIELVGNDLDLKTSPR
jgi:hypothetical protein